MAKIEIDNKKLWESLIQLMSGGDSFMAVEDVTLALRHQGLCYKDGEITTIESEVKWYVALNDYGHYDNIIGAVPLFLKGERTTKENVFNMCKNIMGYEITEEEFNKNFRPATEEEIPQTNSTKPYNPLKEQGVATNHIESKPEPKKCLYTKDHYTDKERKELCEGCQEECKLNKDIKPKERKVSGVLKKMLDNLDEESLAKTREEMLEETELTDFEKVLAECIHKAQGSILSPEGVAITWSDALMAEARKQIASEIDVDAMMSEYKLKELSPSLATWLVEVILNRYRQGIEATISKIKGENV